MTMIAALTAGLVLASGTFGGSSGTLGGPSGTFGAAPKAGGLHKPSSVRPTAPRAPAAPKAPSIGDPDAGPFRPYKGKSTYSSRGGVDAYPSAPKPKGYINPYGR